MAQNPKSLSDFGVGWPHYRRFVIQSKFSGDAPDFRREVDQTMADVLIGQLKLDVIVTICASLPIIFFVTSEFQNQRPSDWKIISERWESSPKGKTIFNDDKLT